jgi:Polysaccharide pyruvyl transferase
LAGILDHISQQMNDATIVFFAAGTVSGHDSLKNYEELANLTSQPTRILYHQNVWNVVALISRAKIVLGTSLHVRIMAFYLSQA